MLFGIIKPSSWALANVLPKATYDSRKEQSLYAEMSGIGAKTEKKTMDTTLSVHLCTVQTYILRE